MADILRDWRLWVFGVLAWFIPFAISIPFFSPDGGLMIAQPLFKSIMVVVGGMSGVALLVWFFRRHQIGAMTGLVIGLIWMVINLALDVVVLIPMSGDSLGGYYADIGLRYWMQPIIAMGMGAVAGR